MSGFFSLFSNPRLSLIQSPSSSFPLLLHPIFQSPTPYFPIPAFHFFSSSPPTRSSPLSLFHPSFPSLRPSFPADFYSLSTAHISPPRRYHQQKMARKPPFHRSSGRSSRCFVLRLPSVTACPSVSLSLLLRQGAQYIQTGRSVYSDSPLSIFRQGAQYIQTERSVYSDMALSI